MRNHSRGSLAVALLVAGLLGATSAPAWAQAKTPPVQVSAVVKGLAGDSAKAVEKALKEMDSVDATKVDNGTVQVQVKAEKTFRWTDLTKVVEASSTKEKPLEIKTSDVNLVGTVEIDLSGTGDAKDDAIAGALKKAPNVDKVDGSAGKFNVTFKGSQGAKVGQVLDALKKGLGVKEGDAGPKIDDIAWTAPKAGAGTGKHG